VVERDSAVRILVGDETPPRVLRIRNGRNASNFEIRLADDLNIVVASGTVDRSGIRTQRVGDASVFLDDPARILTGLELRFLRENLPIVALWLRSLALSRGSIEAAYQEHPRPVVIRRLAHLAEDAGNHRLAEILAEVVRANQRVRIGRGQTGVGRDLIVPPQIRDTPTTHRPWLDRQNLQFHTFQQQITEIVDQFDLRDSSFSAPDLIAEARGAKAYDVYHSTSIEGYRIRYEDVSVLLGGSPEGALAEEEIRNRMAILGYSSAFDNLLSRIEQEWSDLAINNILILDLYTNLFQPSVEAGLVEPEALRGWRNAPVFPRKTRYVPPAAERIGDMLSALMEHLPRVPSALVRAILGHLMLVTIHPFPDGNGRVGRFLMNAILVSNGWPWLTIQEGERGAYFEALKEAQLENNARAFGLFIVERELPLVRSLPND
jgi:Fic family protein